MPLTIIVLDDNASVVISEFMNALSATTARRARTRLILTAARDRDRHNALASGLNHGRNRAALGTTALRVGGVLNITANMNVAVFVEKCGTNAKV